MKRFLKYMLGACLASCALGFLLLVYGFDVGMLIAFVSMAIGAFPAFYFASQVAFTAPKESDEGRQKIHKRNAP